MLYIEKLVERNIKQFWVKSRKSEVQITNLLVWMKCANADYCKLGDKKLKTKNYSREKLGQNWKLNLDGIS